MDTVAVVFVIKRHSAQTGANPTAAGMRCHGKGDNNCEQHQDTHRDRSWLQLPH
jgi:hypothetical protein